MLVFNAIKGRLGGRVRVIVSGSAPLAPQIEAFLRVALCAPFVQVGSGTCRGASDSFTPPMRCSGRGQHLRVVLCELFAQVGEVGVLVGNIAGRMEVKMQP